MPFPPRVVSHPPSEAPAKAGEAPAKAGEAPAKAGEAPAKAGEAPAKAGEAPEAGAPAGTPQSPPERTLLEEAAKKAQQTVITSKQLNDFKAAPAYNSGPPKPPAPGTTPPKSVLAIPPKVAAPVQVVGGLAAGADATRRLLAGDYPGSIAAATQTVGSLATATAPAAGLLSKGSGIVKSTGDLLGKISKWPATQFLTKGLPIGGGALQALDGIRSGDTLSTISGGLKVGGGALLFTPLAPVGALAIGASTAFDIGRWGYNKLFG